MKTKLILTEEQKGLLHAVETTPNYWHRFPLPDLAETPLYNRELQIKMFGVTPTENFNSEMFTMQAIQVITHKETGEEISRRQESVWDVTKHNHEELTDSNGDVIMVTEQTIDDNGEVIEEKQVPLKAHSINYIKFLLMNKKVHLVDVFEKFSQMYYNKFKTEIDKTFR